ncbi:MAG: glycosyltransferase [Alphaproteobacteria bacterium]|nr:glycosyltransferase [Alphaproteobacteria bacterium SS10]
MSGILNRAGDWAWMPKSVGDPGDGYALERARAEAPQRFLVLNRFGRAVTYDRGIDGVGPPTGRLARDLCRGLADAGYQAELIADDQHRMPTSRLASYLRQATRLVRRLLCHPSQRRGTTLVVMTDPPLMLPFVVMLGTALRMPVIYWCQDLYPDVLEARSGWAGSFLRFALAPLRLLHRRSMARCDRVVVPSECLRDRLCDHGFDGAVEVISNWAEADLKPSAPTSTTADQRIRVLYSGHYGVAHDLTDLVQAAALIGQSGFPIDIHLALSERGLQRFLSRHPMAEQIGNLTIGGQVANADLQDHLAAADIHVVSIKPGAEGTVFPCKALAACRVGRPLILLGTGKSSMAKLIEEGGAGYVAKPGDATGLIDWLDWMSAERSALEAMGANAMVLGQSLGLEHGASRLVTLLTGEGPTDTVAERPLAMPEAA